MLRLCYSLAISYLFVASNSEQELCLVNETIVNIESCLLKILFPFQAAHYPQDVG